MAVLDLDGLSRLTRRERDCLKQLSEDLTYEEAAKQMAISPSTFNRHLLSARSKLGVRTTRQAILIYDRATRISDSMNRHLPIEAFALDTNMDDVNLLFDLVGSLADCVTFDQAWQVLRRHTAPLGVEHVNFGLVAEPFGYMTNGARLVGTTLSDDHQKLYKECGGVSVDPLAHYVARNSAPLVLDLEELLRRAKQTMPRNVDTMEVALIDCGCRHFVCIPDRDNATNAPYGIVCFLHPAAARAIGRDWGHLMRTLSVITKTFWFAVQDKQLLRPFVPLSSRQCNVLKLALRGFSTAQMATHLGRSTRTIEQTLTTTRNSLGVHTTTAAIYRATVYRALK